MGSDVASAVRNAAATLAPASDSPRLDAELLMAQARGVSRSELLLRHMAEPSPAAFAALVERRASGEPVAYILGRQPFFGLELRVTPAVLIPRSDSETLVAAALAARPDAKCVLDCGTGSGALLLAVLANLPAAQGVGIDRSRDALAVARDNAQRLGLAGRATLREADWTTPGWAAPLGRFDLILANPPYVETGASGAALLSHEPAYALFAGPDGLDAHRLLLPQLPALLAPGGVALAEIGAAQAEMAGAIARDAGLTVRLHRDLAGRARVLQLSLARQDSAWHLPGECLPQV
ncbi:MAG: peptide chain release factor N(5)-glutamine methyltransferase [Novosphingobium sp.]